MKIRNPQSYSPKPGYVKMSTDHYNRGHNSSDTNAKDPKFYGSAMGSKYIEEAFQNKVGRGGRKKKPTPTPTPNPED